MSDDGEDHGDETAEGTRGDDHEAEPTMGVAAQQKASTGGDSSLPVLIEPDSAPATPVKDEEEEDKNNNNIPAGESPDGAAPVEKAAETTAADPPELPVEDAAAAAAEIPDTPPGEDTTTNDEGAKTVSSTDAVTQKADCDKASAAQDAVDHDHDHSNSTHDDMEISMKLEDAFKEESLEFQAPTSQRRRDPPPPPPPKKQLSNSISPKPPSRGPLPLKNIEENDSLLMDNSSEQNLDSNQQQQQEIPPLSEDKMNFIRDANKLPASPSVASVVSVPDTARAKSRANQRRVSRQDRLGTSCNHNSSDDQDASATEDKKMSSSERQHDSRGGGRSDQHGQGGIVRNNSFKGMWKGIKKRITGGGKKSSRSPPPGFPSSSPPPDSPNDDSNKSHPYRRAKTSPVPPRPRLIPASVSASVSTPNVAGPAVARGREGGRKVPNRNRSRSESPLRAISPFGRQRVELNEEELKELETVAKAFKKGMKTYEHHDRMRNKVIKDCFNGSAAVDFLSLITQATRPQALEIGRQFVVHFGLFDQATLKVVSNGMRASATAMRASTSMRSSSTNHHDSHLLQDSSSAIYHMVAFLPSEVKNMNMEAKARIFEERVSVKTRRQGLRKFKKCFVGSEAVSFLVQSRLVSSRAEAVVLGTRFITDFNLFEPVNRDHGFIDARTKLYRFVEKKNRYFSINNFLSTRLVQMGREDSDIIGDEADEEDEDGGSSLGGKSERVSDTGDSDSGEADQESDILTQEHQRLLEVADVLERGIKVGDNTKKATVKKKGVSYVDTFVAARAVTFMVTSGLAATREEGEALGRRMEREFNLFTEVTGKNDFSDSNHFFRFTDKTDRFMKPVKVQKPLEEIASAFEQGVKVKDHTYRLKTYKKTFTGANAVDFLVNCGLASTRVHAVRIGCQLADKFNLFERVTGHREFCDDQQFFRFTRPGERRQPEAATPANWRNNASRTKLLLTQSTASRHALVPKDIPEDTLRLAESFLEGVKVKEHKFRAKPYRQTFVGSEAVSFMVNSSLAQSRKEAVDLGKKLSIEIGLFVQVDGQKDFKDDYLLYRFTEKIEERYHKESGSAGLSGVIKSLPLEKIAESFREGVKVGKHQKKNKTHTDVFAGHDAVDFLVGSGLAENRVEAVDLGRSIAREFSLFEHVHREHEFEDEEYLYKFCYEGPIRPLEEIEMEISRLIKIAKDLELCVKVKEHKFRLRKFKSTFLGSEAVDYLVNSCTAVTRKQAVQIGRAITKEFSLIGHVTNDRKFEDANIPYFFVKNDERYKGLNLEKRRARRNIFEQSDDEVSNDSETSGLRDAEDLFSSVSTHDARGHRSFSFQTEDDEWANKMANFERKMQSSAAINSASTRFFNVPGNDDAGDDSTVDSSVVRQQKMGVRFFEWAAKFHRLDPRYQIQYFFDFVAQDGAEDVEAHVMEVDKLRPLFNFLPNRAQVFSVWRPTSNDA